MVEGEPKPRCSPILGIVHRVTGGTAYSAHSKLLSVWPYAQAKEEGREETRVPMREARALPTTFNCPDHISTTIKTMRVVPPDKARRADHQIEIDGNGPILFDDDYIIEWFVLANLGEQ